MSRSAPMHASSSRQAGLLLVWFLALFLISGCQLPQQMGGGGADHDWAVLDDDDLFQAHNPPVVSAQAFFSLGRLAFVWEDSLYVLDGETAQTRRLTPPGWVVTYPLWSPSGHWLAAVQSPRDDGQSVASSQPTLMLLAASGDERYVIDDLPGPVLPGGYAWSPDADLLAAAPQEGGLWLLRPGFPPAQLVAAPHDIDQLVWSPDGSTLAYVENVPGAAKASEAVSRSSNLARQALRTVQLGPISQQSPSDSGLQSAADDLQIRTVAHIQGEPVVMLDWWPDGQGFVYSQGSNQANSGDTPTPLQSVSLDGRHRPLPVVTAPHPQGHSWLQGENRLLVVANDGQPGGSGTAIVSCDVTEAQCEPFRPWEAAASDGEFIPLSVAVAPTGDRVAFVLAQTNGARESDYDGDNGPKGSGALWWADINGEGRQEVDRANSSDVMAYNWSADGRRLLAVQDNALWLLTTDGVEEPRRLLAPWWPPNQGSRHGQDGYENWTGRLAWHQPDDIVPMEERRGLMGPILVRPAGQRSADGLVTAQGQVNLSVAATKAQRVEFYAAPADDTGLGALFWEDWQPENGRFTAPWVPPISDQAFRLTAVAYEGEQTWRRTLLIRGIEPGQKDTFLPGSFQPQVRSLHAYKPVGVPREFLAHGWFTDDELMGSVGPFLAVHNLTTQESRALGGTGFEPRISPDGSQAVYFSSGQSIHLIGRDGRNRRLLWSLGDGVTGLEGDFVEPQWSPLGNSLLATFDSLWDREHYLIRLSPPRVERLKLVFQGYFRPESGGWVNSEQIAWTGTALEPASAASLHSSFHIASHRSDIFLYNLTTNQSTKLTAAEPGQRLEVVGVQSQGVLFRRSGQGTAPVYGLMDLKGRVLWEAKLGEVVNLAAAPDGRKVAYAAVVDEGEDNVVMEIGLFDGQKNIQLAQVQVGDVLTGPFWSPGGQHLLISYNTYVPGSGALDPLGHEVIYQTIVITLAGLGKA